MNDDDLIQFLRGPKVPNIRPAATHIVEDMILLRAPASIGGGGSPGGGGGPPVGEPTVYWYLDCATGIDDYDDGPPEHFPDFSIAWAIAVDGSDGPPPPDFEDYPIIAPIPFEDGYGISNQNYKATAIANIRASAGICRVWWTVKNTRATAIILTVDESPVGGTSEIHLDPDETTSGDTGVPPEPADPDISVDEDSTESNTGVNFFWEEA